MAVGRHVGMVIVLAAILAGCTTATAPTDSGGTRSADESSPTKTDASTDDGSTSPPPMLSTRRFQTPSRNILCQSHGSSLLCVIHSGLVPEPSAKFCPVDWIGLFVEVGRFAGPACSGDPGIQTGPATVVPYGSVWSRSGVTCRSEAVGLTCGDIAGNGFSLARAGWRLIGKRAAARSAFDELRQLVLEQAASDFTHPPHSVHGPTLRAGDDCDRMQQAFVDLLVDQRNRNDVPVIYEACYVSGTWYIDGPLFPD
jgi:hypothetical protein